MRGRERRQKDEGRRSGRFAFILHPSAFIPSREFPPPILDGDFLYANSSGTIKCLHWPDGRVAWESKDRRLDLGPGGSMLRAGDLMITLSERGKLSLARATPQRLELLSQSQPFDAHEVWSTPLLYNGWLYVKAGEEFVCLDIGRD